MSARKVGEAEPQPEGDGGSAQASQSVRASKSTDDSDKKSTDRKLKDVDICVPIVYGTIAFYLGRKASESQSHKWTVYVRGATNEDLGAVVKRVVFQLHPSFNNPMRVIESPPFELTECGWGEFEIAISLFFHNDICEKQLDLYHHLKLYTEDESGPQSTKKPVVMESYNEIVFPDPSEAFFARVQNHPAVIVPRLPAGINLPKPVVNDNMNENKRGDTKDHPLSQWFLNFSEADELLKLAAARQEVQAHIVNVRRKLSLMEGVPQLSKQPSGFAKTLRRCDLSSEQDIEDLFSQDETQKIRASLLKWYGLNRRDLPWREQEDDVEVRVYRVWVSEVMLQQTRVQAVIHYFNRWMSKWPTIHSLAQASLEEVNEMWAGLGYYRRARFLLEGARKIVAEGDQFPKTVSQLRKIPGIGDYTAGAIASIALKEAVPVVDGNVIRVTARLKAISANPKDSSTVKKFWKLAAQLVDPFQPGDFNQALMELGATVCTPSSPSCGTCPVSDQCCALSISRHDSSVVVTDYPIKVVKAKQRHEFSAVCVVEIVGDEESLKRHQINNGFLLVKRPDEGLLAGLWEFPSVSLAGEVDLLARRKAIDQYLKKYFTLQPRKTCDIICREHVGEYVHVFSHIRLKMYVELLILRVEGGINDLVSKRDKDIVPWKCVDAKVLSNMGLTSGVKKVYTMVQKFRRGNLSSDLNLDSKKRKRRAMK